MKKPFILIGLLLLVGIGTGTYFYLSSHKTMTQPTSAENTPQTSATIVNGPALAAHTITLSPDDLKQIQVAVSARIALYKSGDVPKIRAALSEGLGGDHLAYIQNASDAELKDNASTATSMLSAFVGILADPSKGTLRASETSPNHIRVLVQDPGETSPDIGTVFYFTRANGGFTLTNPN